MGRKRLDHFGEMPERQCVATSKHTGERCGNWAMRGIDRCRIHHGNTPSMRKAALANIEISAAEKFGLQPAKDVDPLDALEDLLARASRMVERLGGRIEGHLDKGRSVQEMSMLQRTYLDWLGEMRQLAKVISDVGIDERRMKLDESITLELAKLVKLGLRRAGFSPADQERAVDGIATEVRARFPRSTVVTR